MNNYESIYWLTRLDGLLSVCKFIYASTLISSIILIVSNYIELDFDQYYSGTVLRNREASRTTRKRITYFLLPISLIFGVLQVLIPTRNEALLIMAGGKTLNYVQSDTSLAKIPYQTTQIISNYLDKTIKEIKEDK